MKLSIVVPSYNQVAYLPYCLDSILEQADEDTEILVYDGGSTDGSREIIAQRESGITYWQSQPDNGQAAILREGFERAIGEGLLWLNSDDILLPGALAHMRQAIDDNPRASLIYGDAIWIDAGGNPLRPKREIAFDWKIFAYGYCYIPQPSAVFRRCAYEEAGGVDSSFKCCMDYDLWHRLCRTGEVVHIPLMLSGIRAHGESKTSTLTPVFRTEEEELRRRYLRWGRTISKFYHIWQRLRRVYLRCIQGCYKPLTERERKLCTQPRRK